MRRMMVVFTELIYHFGKTYAGRPSNHGTYEAPVPKQLQK